MQWSKGFTEFSSADPEAGQAENETTYDKDMDATRCILYFHGGENFLFLG